MLLGKGIVRSVIALVTIGASIVALSGPAWALSTTPDTTWMTSGKLYASVRLDNTLYVGGTFTKVKPGVGQLGKAFTVSNLAAFDVSTGEGIPTWTPDVTSSTGTPAVRSLALSADGAWLYVGGNFDAIDGWPLRNLGRVSTATGEVDATFAPQVGTLTSFVYAILTSTDKIYFGGLFASVSGKRRPRLAAVGTDGTVDPDWRPVPDKRVRSLAFAPDGATVFVGGLFSNMNGVPRQSVARLTADTGALDPWTIPAGTIVAPQTVWSFAVTPTRLYGGFGSTGPNYLAAFRLDNGSTGDQVWRFNTVGNVQTVELSPSGTQLYFGGHFGLGHLQQTVCGNMPLKGLALVNPVNGQIDCSWVPYLEPNNFQGVWSLVASDAYLWVAGGFTTIEGVTHHAVARFTL